MLRKCATRKDMAQNDICLIFSPLFIADGIKGSHKMDNISLTGHLSTAFDLDVGGHLKHTFPANSNG